MLRLRRSVWTGRYLLFHQSLGFAAAAFPDDRGGASVWSRGPRGAASPGLLARLEAGELLRGGGPVFPATTTTTRGGVRIDPTAFLLRRTLPPSASTFSQRNALFTLA